MSHLSALEWTQALPHRVPLKEVAPSNIRDMCVTLDTSHFEMSALNKVAPLNIRHMSVTLDTSHFEMSALNESAQSNIPFMSATLDTSHSPIAPWGPLPQRPCAEISRHADMAFSSSFLDVGLNTAVDGVGGGKGHG